MKSSHILLALDTSQGMTSLALWHAGAVVAQQHDTRGGRQAAMLIPDMQAFLTRHDADWEALEAIACVTGPGGFTSVRIGVASARALAYGLGVPCYGVPLTHVMAWYTCKRHDRQRIRCLLPAGRDMLAMQTLTLRRNSGGYALHEEGALTCLPRAEIDWHAPDGVALCGAEGVDAPVACDLLRYPVEETAALLADLLAGTEDAPQRYTAPAPLYARPADARVSTPLLGSLSA